VFVTGSAPVGRDLFTALEAHGLQVVGDEFRRHRRGPDVARAAEAGGAEVVLAWIRSGDDARAWSIPALRRALDLPLVVLDRREDEAVSDDELGRLS
jgi:hypothetical protein